MFKHILFILCLLGSAVVLAANPSILVLSDIHLDIAATQPMLLEPSGSAWLADLDLPTYRAMLQRIQKNIAMGDMQKPNYILVLGDLVAHAHTDTPTVIATEKIVFTTLKETFPNIPIVYNFGNHDSLLKNYGPFRSGHPEDPYQSPFDIADSVWPSGGFIATAKTCIPHQLRYPCVLSSSAEEGYYAAYLADKLLVISLNSVLFSTRQEATIAPKVAQQLQWLAELLADAHAHHDAVLLLAHIPPGNNTHSSRWTWSSPAFWTPVSLEPFLKLVGAYSSDILGILSGHTHKDELKIMRNSQGTPVAGVYLNAALSSINGNSPAVRSYALERKAQNWYLHDYRVYRFTSAAPPETVNLEFLYSYQEVYCTAVSDAMTNCLNNVSLEKMQRYYTAGNPYYTEPVKLPENMMITLPAEPNSPYH